MGILKIFVFSCSSFLIGDLSRKFSPVVFFFFCFSGNLHILIQAGLLHMVSNFFVIVSVGQSPYSPAGMIFACSLRKK